ncbi:MAG TPA: hypothetical protein VFK48_12810 [Usitatibacter sp.]|nr:hypothetical protein [Usitatibacter sp.]
MSARQSPGVATLSAVLLCAVWALELARMVQDTAAARAIAIACLGLFGVFAWFRASRHIRALFVVILGAAAAGAWAQGSAEPIVGGVSRALVFGAFFPAVLMLRATVEASPRLGELRAALARLDGTATEIVTLQASHGLAGVINVGAAAVLAPVVTSGVDDARRAVLAATCARGVAIAAMWSPFYLSVAFTTQLAPNVPMWEVMAIGAAASVIGLALSHAMFTRGGSGLAESLASLRPIAVPTAIVVGVVVAGTLAFAWSGLHSVAVAIPLLCAAYAIALGANALPKVLRQTFTSAGRVSDEMLIVLGGTILGAVVGSLPYVQQLGASVTPEMVSGMGAIAGLVVILLALGQAGLHPMIASSVLVPVLCVGNFGVCDAIAVASAVFAWGLNATISIWTMPMAMAASTFAIPVGRLTTRRSLVYTVAYLVLGVLFLTAVNAALRSAGCD